MSRCARATFAVAACLLLAACAQASVGGDEGPEGAEDTAAEGSAPRVVTSVFPLAAVAEEIAPDADVELLTARGQDPHDLELSPGDRGAIQDADVVLYMGDLGFQPQVEQAVQTATGEVVSAADVVGPDDLLDLREDDHDDHDDDGDDAGRAHADVDPHVWLAPALMGGVAEAIGDALATTDPDAAEDYHAAAATVAEELAALDAEIDARLADCAYDTALVGHEAWGYLLEPRGLRQLGISGAGGHGEPSPQRLAELTDRIESEGIPGVFAEPVEGRENAEALAAEAGVELLEVDPLETPADAEQWLERGYPDLLLTQVDTFAEGLQCRT